ncbi:MAG TPA: hypothetical protein VH394_01495 [Thermoanaerobaculia bacterium]|nr:hypothetical protein [Thermoanaerobaculia bacterium]
MAVKSRQIGKVPRAWIWIAGLVVLGLLTLDVHVERARAEDQAGAAGPTPASVNRTNELRLRGWATRSRVATSGSVRIYFTIENRSDKRVDDIHLFITGQGFKPAGWIHLGVFAPGAATTQAVDLKALSETSSGIITARADWRVGKARSNTTLAIGPVEVRTEESLGLILSRTILSFFKDLALPIVLVLLAYAVQHLQQEKTSHEETFHAMLPRAHENIVRFLLPIVSSANRFLRYLPEAQKKDAAALQQTFYHLLSIAKGMHNCSRKGGGIFFTNIPGETAVSNCWKELLARMGTKLGDPNISEMFDEWGRIDSFTSFQKRFKSQTAITDEARAAFVAAETSFKGWIQEEFGYEKQLVQVFKDIMQYEIDKIYGPWYLDEPPVFEEDSRSELENLKRLRACPEPLRKALGDFERSLPAAKKTWWARVGQTWVRAYRSVGPSGNPPGKVNQNSGGESTPPSQGEPSKDSNSPPEPPIPPPPAP